MLFAQSGSHSEGFSSNSAFSPGIEFLANLAEGFG